MERFRSGRRNQKQDRYRAPPLGEESFPSLLHPPLTSSALASYLNVPPPHAQCLTAVDGHTSELPVGTLKNIQHPRANNPEPLLLGLGDVNVSPGLRATAQAIVLGLWGRAKLGGRHGGRS